MKRTMWIMAAGCAAWIGSAPLSAQESQELSGTEENVIEAVSVLGQMQQQIKVKPLLEASEGVLIVPDYATAALIAGVSGGEGILFTHRDGKWSNPVFYDIGGASVGYQAGVAAGSMALVLMNDKALNQLMSKNEFALTGEAGLSILNWSKFMQEGLGRGDVVVWTDMEGLIAKAAVGFSNVRFDADDTSAYYNQIATPQKILSGELENPHAKVLQQVLEKLDPTQAAAAR